MKIVFVLCITLNDQDILYEYEFQEQSTIVDNVWVTIGAAHFLTQI